MVTLADIYTPEVLAKLSDAKKNILKCGTSNETATRPLCECGCKDYPVEKGGTLDSKNKLA